MSDLLSKIRELRDQVTSTSLRVYNDDICNRDGTRGGAPVQEIHTDLGTPLARLTIYSNPEDAALIVLLVNHLDELEKALEERDGKA